MLKEQGLFSWGVISALFLKGSISLSACPGANESILPYSDIATILDVGIGLPGRRNDDCYVDAVVTNTSRGTRCEIP